MIPCPYAAKSTAANARTIRHSRLDGSSEHAINRLPTDTNAGVNRLCINAAVTDAPTTQRDQLKYFEMIFSSSVGRQRIPAPGMDGTIDALEDKHDLFTATTSRTMKSFENDSRASSTITITESTDHARSMIAQPTDRSGEHTAFLTTKRISHIKPP